MFIACIGGLPRDGQLETDVSMELILNSTYDGMFKIIEPIYFNTSFAKGISFSKGISLSGNIKIGDKSVKEIAKMNFT
ncbi:hypothetical protein L3081_24440 [Colwellia sp. MSW7]|uniref:Uncharacterized protein n=1 Tax=Colwellia maritima TaxID=2912588 RepID=A0ABS9X6X4_9GAMM|nr:hypothetical protein [Colwellia maritima]MCI2285979.1 hypothetical protein [Colwellia maritima]